MRFRPLAFDYHTEATNLLRDAREQTSKILIRRSLDHDEDVETDTDDALALEDELIPQETTALKIPGVALEDEKSSKDKRFGSESNDSSVREAGTMERCAMDERKLSSNLPSCGCLFVCLFRTTMMTMGSTLSIMERDYLRKSFRSPTRL